MEEVPVHAVLLMETREEAVEHSRGLIELRYCADCRFVFNGAFDGSLLEYSDRYEETQGFSPTFRSFHRRLAEDLIDRWGLRGKHILEIGCGKGEFLALICELGGNTGVGFDPAFLPERNPAAEGVDVRYYRELFPPSGGLLERDRAPDFVCCKMTLEHIPDVRRFVRDIRNALEGAPDTVVFFQVPDTGRIFRDAAFWDVYYEHCSYFTEGSLARLFELCGFEITETWTDYDDQYLMLTAVPTREHGAETTRRLEPERRGPAGAYDEDIARFIETFGERARSDARGWTERIRAERDAGGSVCLWGAGSKAVSFLSAVESDLVSQAVDINPHKQGTYLPGSGVEILTPEALREDPPSLVIAMNPVYLDEIAADLRRMNIEARLVGLGA